MEHGDHFTIVYLAAPPTSPCAQPVRPPVLLPHRSLPEITFTKVLKVRPIPVLGLDTLDYGSAGPSKRRAPETSEGHIDQRAAKAARINDHAEGSDIGKCLKASEAADRALAVAMDNYKKAHRGRKRNPSSKV
jgi:hypothetical protein